MKKLLYAIVCLSSLSASADTTAFTYQGKLSVNGIAGNGNYDVRFGLFEFAEFGFPAAPLLTNMNVTVSGGLFTTSLDFGTVFTGSNYWLEIGVRTNGSAGAFTALAPRQPITPTPYAINAATAANVTGSISDAQLSSNIPRLNSNQTFNGSVSAIAFSGDGGGVTNVNAATLNGLASTNFWRLGGNTDTVAETAFLGTVDNQPLELKVNSQRALRLEPTATSPNIIGGYRSNSVATGVVGATIGGGGGEGALTNSARANYATIAGGSGNFVSSGAVGSVIGGGENNSAGANLSAVLSGAYNRSMSSYAVIAGGLSNSLSTAAGSFIGGGTYNRMAYPCENNVIGGGVGNYMDSGVRCFIGGGTFNSIRTSYNGVGSAVISGGESNLVSGDFATVPGGKLNAANGIFSFAAGYRAKANGAATFVWADYAEADFMASGDNQFLIRASGGVGINTNAPQSALHVNGTVTATSFHGDGSDLTFNGGFVGIGRTNTISSAEYFGVEAPVTLGYGGMYINTTGPGGWPFYGYSQAGVQRAYHYIDGSDTNKWKLNVGNGVRVTVTTDGNVGIGTTNPTNRLHVAGGVSATVFVTTSDRNAKENFKAVQPREILQKVAALPISEWTFKEHPGTPHVGPTAQDFHAAVGVGGSDVTIATVDADGIALAAIQGLNQKVEEKEAEILTLREKAAKVDSLEERVAALEKLLGSLAEQRHLVK